MISRLQFPDRHIHLNEVTSTNDYALSLDTDGIVITAETQTGGKGRLGRAWASRPKESFIFTGRTGAEQNDAPALGILPLTAGLAVLESLRLCHFPNKPDSGRQCNMIDTGRIMLKWPNDIVYQEGTADENNSYSTIKKIGGILCESAFHNDRFKIAVGIGLNLTVRAWSEAELNRLEPGALFDCTRDNPDNPEKQDGQGPAADKFAKQYLPLLCDALNRYTEKLNHLNEEIRDQILKRYQKNCWNIGRYIQSGDEREPVEFLRVTGLTREGNLLLENGQEIMDADQPVRYSLTGAKQTER